MVKKIKTPALNTDRRFFLGASMGALSTGLISCQGTASSGAPSEKHAENESLTSTDPNHYDVNEHIDYIPDGHEHREGDIHKSEAENHGEHYEEGYFERLGAT